MFKAVKRARHNEEGFTLIELLIVIIILGILAAVVIFAVGSITDRGTTNACKSDVNTAQVAVEAYFAKNSSYPATLAALTTSTPPYLRTDPTANSTYGSKITYASSTGLVSGTTC